MMQIEEASPKADSRRVVSLRLLVIVVVGTVILVSAVFLSIQRLALRPSAQPSQPIATEANEAQSATQNSPASNAAAPRELTDEEQFRRASPSVVLLQAFDRSGQMTKTGSGFVATSDGTVITNYHVIRGAYSERAVFQDGTSSDIAGVLGYDPRHDVAAIRVNAGLVKPLELGDSDKVEVGDRVVAIGSPVGLQNTISDGLISALRPGVLQTSAPISPGSSGGPFLDKTGQVIGIAVASIRTGQNLNFVVPINDAKPYLTNTILTKLAELAAQNTVVTPLFRSTVEIPAHQFREWPFLIDANRMDDAEIKGTFQSSGGFGGRVRVQVQNRATNEVFYDSHDVTNGQIDVKLKPGAYRLVVSNFDSIMFGRTVSADVSVSFVR